jgi:cytochrome d ubiquinol oxidase subunit II
MLLMHGAVFLQIKTVGDVSQRSKKAVSIFAVLTMLAFALAGVWVANIDGYHVASEMLHDGPSNPLIKFVHKETGLWLDNYRLYPLLWGIPGLAFVAGVVTLWLSKVDRPGMAFISSSLTMAAIILTAGVSMFPFLIPSSLSLNSSLTVWDASSSLATLKIMFWVTVIFLPIVITYTSWVFRILRGKVTIEHIRSNDHTVY